MRKSIWIRILVVSAAGLLLAAGAVGAVASARDSDKDSGDDRAHQEATPTPEAAEETPWLGIAGDALDDGAGVAVRHVVPEGPADDAGLESGDVIKAIDGVEVQDVEALREAIEAKDVGDQVTLSVVKNGVEDTDAEASDVDVTLEARPEKRGFGGMLEDKLGEWFDRFLGGSFKYLDDDGNEVTIEAVPGTVKSISENDLTIDVNGDEGDRSFELPEAARVPDELAEGDRVTVVLKDGEVQGVHPGAFGLGGLLPKMDGFPMPFEDGRFEFGPHHGGPFGDQPGAPDSNQEDSGPDA